VEAASRTAKRLERLQAICLALPEATMRGGQHKAFEVRNKKFAYHLVDHHGDGRVSLQCKAAPGENAELIASDPERFYRPPYMARHGWVGLYLDSDEVDWDEIRELVTDAYRLIAPKRLVAAVDAAEASGSG
jgi:predicted DNA-binding protein (MmcQ/YjbR family)